MVMTTGFEEHEGEETRKIFDFAARLIYQDTADNNFREHDAVAT